MDVLTRSAARNSDPSQGRSSVQILWALTVVGFIGAGRAPATDPPARPAVAPSSQTSPGFSGAAVLEKAWPDHPEWLAMLADILVKGERLSGSDGWFRKGVAQTRFNWKSTRTALDANGDDSISLAEFSGPDADFAHLDRNRDGILNAPDFDFTAQGPGTAAASMLFNRADKDGNGKVTRDELDALFAATDSNGLGFLSLADFQESFDRRSPGLRGSPGGPDGPTRWTFLRTFLRKEMGPYPAGPALNELAPDFTLKRVNSQDEVALSQVVGPKPVVLVFGNYTCRPFRGEAGDLEKLHVRYRDRATFIMIYVREAHPIEGWRMEVNDRLGVTVRQPRTYSERDAVAQTCAKTMALGFPTLVDKIDDSVNDRYSGLPSRLYLIDRSGRVAYKSGRGPFGFRPAELEHSLILLLRDDVVGRTNRTVPGGEQREKTTDL